MQIRTLSPLLAAAAAVAVALPLAACDDPQRIGTGAGGDEAAPVVHVEWSGGFVMAGADFARLPRAHLLSDGRHYSEAPTIAIYPGPALVPAQVRDVGTAGVEQLLALADELGLDADRVDYGQPPIADAPATVVTVTIGGRTYEHRAEALAEHPGPERPSERGADEGGMGLTPEQVAARARLAEFVQAAVDPASVLPEGTVADRGLHDADRYRLIALEVPADAAPADPAVAADVRAWPVTEVDLTSPAARTCLPVEGQAAVALEQALEGATAATQWTAGGRSWTLAVRPVLPGEPTCPAQG